MTRDYQSGCTNARQRDALPVSRLYRLLHDALATALAEGVADVDGLTLAAVYALTKNERTRVRATLLAENGGHPRCWVDGLLILADEPKESDGAFSVDHVVRRADGGLWSEENCRPAHSLCNATRVVLERGGKLRPRTARRLAALRERAAAAERDGAA